MKKILPSIIVLFILGTLGAGFFIVKKYSNKNNTHTCLSATGSDTNMYKDEITDYIKNYTGTTNLCFSGLENGWCIMYYNGTNNHKVLQEALSGFGYKTTDGYLYEKLTCDCKIGISTHEVLQGDNIEYYVQTDAGDRTKNIHTALSNGLFVSFPRPTMCQ